MLPGMGRYNLASYSNILGVWDCDEISTAAFVPVSYPTPGTWLRYDGDGSTITDHGSGLFGSLTVVNGPVTADAEGYTFNGSSQYVNGTVSSGTLSATAISLAVLCRPSTFADASANSKVPIGVGVDGTGKFQGIFLEFVRTGTAPERARVRLVCRNGSVNQTLESDANLVTAGDQVYVVGSFSKTEQTMRLLVIVGGSIIRYYVGHKSDDQVYSPFTANLDTGFHRGVTNEYFAGAIRESAVFNGTALKWNQMMSLGGDWLDQEFNLPHIVDRSGNGRHLYAEQPYHFGEILLTELAPGYRGVAVNSNISGIQGTGYHSLWYPDVEQDFRILGMANMAVGCVATFGSFGVSGIGRVLITCAGNSGAEAPVSAQFAELWSLRRSEAALRVHNRHYSGTTERSATDANTGLAVGLPVLHWMSRANGVDYKSWSNDVLSPNSPITVAGTPSGGEVARLRVGCKEPGRSPWVGGISSIILLGAANDAHAASAYAETVGLVFPRVV